MTAGDLIWQETLNSVQAKREMEEEPSTFRHLKSRTIHINLHTLVFQQQERTAEGEKERRNDWFQECLIDRNKEGIGYVPGARSR